MPSHSVPLASGPTSRHPHATPQVTPGYFVAPAGARWAHVPLPMRRRLPGMARSAAAAAEVEAGGEWGAVGTFGSPLLPEAPLA